MRALKTRAQGPAIKAPARIPYKKGRVEQKITWMTPKEAAGYIRVEPKTLLSWARQGKVKAYTLSGTQRVTWRFRTEDLDEALKVNR